MRHLSILALLITVAACSSPPSTHQSGGTTSRGNAPSKRLQTGGRDAQWLGVVLPRQALDLAPEISAQVEHVYVREGDAIRQGQTVAVLYAAQDRQELAIAEVNLRAAEAEVSKSRLELAEADNRLASRLAMPDAFPKEEIRRSELQKQLAEVALESARARVSAQQARLAQARDYLARTAIRAPADGTIARRYVEPGALAGPGRPIVRLIGDGSAIVRFAAPPAQAASLRAGVHVTVATDGDSVPAIIEWVSPELDPPSGMLILVAALDRTAAVKPGSIVRVRREGAV